MKIAIPSDNQTDICGHFGRTKGFIIAEVDNKEVKAKTYIENQVTGHAQGLHVDHDHSEGHDHEHKHQHSHEGILDRLNECEVVIANGMGKRLYNDFQSVGKKVYISSHKSVDGAVQAYIDNNLDHNPDATCSH